MYHNSVDQVCVEFKVRYEGKPIKYCCIVCSPMNAVGDFVACEITGEVEAHLRITGPIESGNHVWNYKGWYNSTIKDIYIEGFELLYMDGSSETISGKKIVQDMRYVQQQIEQQRRQNMCAFNRWAEDHPGRFLLFMIVEFIVIGLICWGLSFFLHF